MIEISKQTARRFILNHQGLLGDYQFDGIKGAHEYIKKVSCIQYDPIDVCSKNAELVLYARVKSFVKRDLYQLLYQDRVLIDHYDKEMSIMPIEKFHHLQRTFEHLTKIHGNRISECEEEMLKHLIDKPFFSAKDLPNHGKVAFFWSPTNLNKVVLEVLYHQGKLLIHHKKNTLKFYTHTSNIISNQIQLEAAISSDIEFLKMKVQARIGSIGLLWNRSSSAFLGLINFKQPIRNQVFKELLEDKLITEVMITGCKDRFYINTCDLEQLKNTPVTNTPRIEFLAPLDNMLWDRKLIQEIFGFEYTWEIYTPQNKRKYGHYVLPILYQDDLVGRIEIVKEKKGVLVLKNIWYEANFEPSDQFYQLLENKLGDFQIFNQCHELISLVGLDSSK